MNNCETAISFHRPVVNQAAFHESIGNGIACGSRTGSVTTFSVTECQDHVLGVSFDLSGCRTA